MAHDSCKQVDILISKNQVLQILYLKHHVYKTSQIIMDTKLNKIHENLIPLEINSHICMPYSTNSYDTIKHKHTL